MNTEKNGLIWTCRILFLLLLILNLIIPPQRIWKENQKYLKEIKSSLDSATRHLNISEHLIDSLQNGLENYTSYIKNLEIRLAEFERERKKSQEKFKSDNKILRDKLKALNALPDSMMNIPVIIIE